MYAYYPSQKHAPYRPLQLGCEVASDELLGDFAYSREAPVSFAISVRLSLSPLESTRFPLDEFLLNLILGAITKIRVENPNFVTVG